MTVNQPGGEDLACGIDHLGLRADGVAAVRPDMGDPGPFHAHGRIFQQLTCLNVQQPAATDHQVGFSVAEGYLHQLRRIFFQHGVI